MIRNYWKTAWRSIISNKMSAFINMGGLSLGIAVVIVIALWIRDEVSYDRFHSHYDKIAKLRQFIHANGTIQTEKTVPYPLAAELRNHYGQYFTHIVMSSHRQAHIVAIPDKQLTQQGVYMEPDAIAMFSLHMLTGDNNALRDPNAVVLSASAARALFGSEEALNRILEIDHQPGMKVTGVYEDLPFNSTVASVQFIGSFDRYVNTSWVQHTKDNWDISPVQAYVQLTADADAEKVSGIIKDVKLRKISATDAQFKPAVFLDPMSKWHLYGDFKEGVRTGGRITTVWMFGVTGFFVLLLACINFMNLSTARSERRAREVGIRKTMGAERRQLIMQFFSESIMVTAFSFAVALVLVQFSLPFFNDIADKKLSVPWALPAYWLVALLSCLVTGLIAGMYPAVYLSSFKPITIVKGIFSAGTRSGLPRKALVVLQFTVSVAMIICTWVVFRQVQFSRERPVGYNREHLLVIPLPSGVATGDVEAMKNELLQTHAIISTATSESTTTDIWATDNNLDWKNKDPNVKVDFPNTGVSYDYGKTVGWQFIEGRDFSKQLLTDSNSFVINEAAAQFMSLQHPVGEIIRSDGRPFTVIGVIRNVITESPYEPVRPSIYCMERGRNNYMFVRTQPNGTAEGIRAMSATWKKYTGSAPFQYSFVDEDYDRKFGSEQKLGRLSTVFAILAIVISCLGLYGLSSFVAERRSKEIGIRKVLGATVFDVWRLLCAGFTSLVVIALLIAIPLAWVCMSAWLQHYTYRVELSWWIFAAAGLAAITIAVLTVTIQSLKAAVADPADTLRSE